VLNKRGDEHEHTALPLTSGDAACPGSIHSSLGSDSHENGCPFKVVAMEKELQTRVVVKKGMLWWS
jgi:hypothetical protein